MMCRCILIRRVRRPDRGLITGFCMGAGARARAPRTELKQELVADDGDGEQYDEDCGDGAEGAPGPHVGEILGVVCPTPRTAGVRDVETERTER